MRKFLRVVFKVFSWAAAVAVLVGLVFAVRYVSRIEKERREQEAAQLKVEEPVPVRVVAVRRGDVREEITVTGNVEAIHKVRVLSKVPGRLDELRVEECSPVKKGAVIAVIDHGEIQAEVARAEAAVGVAQAETKNAEVSVADALREKLRMEELFKDGATNEQNVDRARTAYDSALARRELAQANVKQAEAVLRQAQVKLDDATIESPITGVVCEKHLDQGNMIGREDAIITIVDISSVKILADVSERHLSQLRNGETQAHVSIDSLPGESFTGKVHKIYPSLDPRTRSARLEILVENPAGRLLPGMYARVRLVLAERKNVVIAPISALVTRHDEAFAFVVNSSSARESPVRLGLRSGNQVEVISGLREGDKLVVEGQNNLSDGKPIRVIAAEGAE